MVVDQHVQASGVHLACPGFACGEGWEINCGQPLPGIVRCFKFHPNAQLIQHLQHQSKLMVSLPCSRSRKKNVADPCTASCVVLANAAFFANRKHGGADVFDTANGNAHDNLMIETNASILAAREQSGEKVETNTAIFMVFNVECIDNEAFVSFVKTPLQPRLPVLAQLARIGCAWKLDT